MFCSPFNYIFWWILKWRDKTFYFKLMCLNKSCCTVTVINTLIMGTKNLDNKKKLKSGKHLLQKLFGMMLDWWCYTYYICLIKAYHYYQHNISWRLNIIHSLLKTKYALLQRVIKMTFVIWFDFLLKLLDFTLFFILRILYYNIINTWN